jgi:uncharacterized membrane protein YkvA (DUF1232 family)
MTDPLSTIDTDVPDTDEPSFWRHARASAQRAGHEVIEKALWLFYAAQKPEVPVKAKTVIWGALGYFVMPIDAIPDVLGPVGFTDDLTVLAGALLIVASHIDADVKAKASAKLHDWLDALDRPA